MYLLFVTPRVGVWIETFFRCISNVSKYVTPRVGVWIETVVLSNERFTHLSLPAWECGLKLLYLMRELGLRWVTPRVGVWIETYVLVRQMQVVPKSLPAWECGLKQVAIGYVCYTYPSLPAWECGLKLVNVES